MSNTRAEPRLRICRVTLFSSHSFRILSLFSSSKIAVSHRYTDRTRRTSRKCCSIEMETRYRCSTRTHRASRVPTYSKAVAVQGSCLLTRSESARTQSSSRTIRSRRVLQSTKKLCLSKPEEVCSPNQFHTTHSPTLCSRRCGTELS